MKKALFVPLLSLLLSTPHAADLTSELEALLKEEQTYRAKIEEQNDRIFEALTGKKASPEATIADLESELAALEEKQDDTSEIHGAASTTEDEELAALERNVEEEMAAEEAARKARIEARRVARRQAAAAINIPTTPVTQTWAEWLWSFVQ